jgi:hypothetical protein
MDSKSRDSRVERDEWLSWEGWLDKLRGMGGSSWEGWLDKLRGMGGSSWEGWLDKLRGMGGSSWEGCLVKLRGMVAKLGGMVGYWLS